MRLTPVGLGARAARRGPLLVAIALGGLLAAFGLWKLLAWLSPGGEASAVDRRPNIVVVMTDDQTLRSLRGMPELTRAMSGGTDFTQAISSYPLCSPSRATFLTGQYAHNHGVQENGITGPGLESLDDTRTVPVALSESGYRTALIGKYFNGYGRIVKKQGLEDSVPPGWTGWDAVLEGEDLDWTLNRNGSYIDRFGTGEDDYKTDVLADIAVEKIERPSDSPLFMYLATGAPHSEPESGASRNPQPAERYLGAFDDAELPSPPSFDEADMSDKPSFLQVPRLTPALKEDALARYRGRSESLLAVEEAVVRIREALERTGELEDTVFIFTSDNGYGLGEHRYTGKVRLWEESYRVPLLITGPGFDSGETISSPVTNVDLAPTVLAAARVEPLLPLDGVPLQEVAADPESGADRTILLENRTDGDAAQPGAGVIDEGYSYVEYGRPDGSQELELYDLERDPFQLENESANPDYDEVRERLATRLDELRDCAGEACR